MAMEQRRSDEQQPVVIGTRLDIDGDVKPKVLELAKRAIELSADAVNISFEHADDPETMADVSDVLLTMVAAYLASIGMPPEDAHIMVARFHSLLVSQIEYQRAGDATDDMLSDIGIKTQ